MTQSKLIDELNQTIVDLQSQLDAAKVLLRRVAESPVDLENDGQLCMRINSDVIATIKAILEEK